MPPRSSAGFGRGDERMLELLRQGRHEPLVREAFAIELVDLEPGLARQTLGALADERDLPVGFGRVAVAADSTLGVAVSATLPVDRIPLTLSLHVDVVGDIPPDDEPLVAEAWALRPSGSTLPAMGEVRTARGALVALASLRDLALEARGRTARRSESIAAEAADSSVDRPPVGLAAEPAAARERTRARPAPAAAASPTTGNATTGAPWPAMVDARRVDGGGVEAQVPLTLAMANAARIVQGGVGVALCEELARRAMTAPLGDAAGSAPMTLTAHFLAGARCDGSMATVRAVPTGAHGRTRRVESSIHLADGSIAVVADLAFRTH